MKKFWNTVFAIGAIMLVLAAIFNILAFIYVGVFAMTIGVIEIATGPEKQVKRRRKFKK